MQGTENPLTKRPAIDARFWQESARKQYLNDRKTKMKISQLEDPQTQRVSQVRTFFFLSWSADSLKSRVTEYVGYKSVGKKKSTLKMICSLQHFSLYFLVVLKVGIFEHKN